MLLVTANYTIYCSEECIVRVLLDTCCFLWLNSAPERLSVQARALVRDPSNEVLLSAASAWEITQKHSKGNLPLPQPPREFVESCLSRMKIRCLPLSCEHAAASVHLPFHHKDPFDRMIVAQASVESAHLLTVDGKLSPYGIAIIWADGKNRDSKSTG